MKERYIVGSVTPSGGIFTYGPYNDVEELHQDIEKIYSRYPESDGWRPNILAAEYPAFYDQMNDEDKQRNFGKVRDYYKNGYRLHI